MPLFSVIIPAYNRADLIEQTLASVFAQTFTDYEIIVVDDGSTDDTQAVVARYLDRVRYTRQENAGVGVARNTGVNIAHGQYIAWLDSDDLWFPWTLASISQVIEKNGQPSLVLGSKKGFHEPADLRGVKPCELQYENYASFFASDKAMLTHSFNGTVVRTDIARKVGGYACIRLCEDLDFLLRVGDAEGYAYIRQPLLLGYRWHAQNISRMTGMYFEGFQQILEQEHQGRYPGSPLYDTARRRLLAFHGRALVYQCVVAGLFKLALHMYGRTLGWNLRFGRVRYLLGFWIMLGRQWVKSVFSASRV